MREPASATASVRTRPGWRGSVGFLLLLALLVLAAVQAWQFLELRSLLTPAGLQQLQQQPDALQAQRRVVRLHVGLGLAATALLTLSTLALALVTLQQMQRLRERRLALEALAASLRDARQVAESASQAKSTFLANMSHEIRTPFHALMGMLSLLRETGLTARQVDYVRTATESADHLLALLNDILDMSQLESGRLALAPTPVLLRTLLFEVEALMRPQAVAKSLALHVDTDPAVPERVLMDATRVRQILFNLLSNAIKFTDRGAVMLDVRCAGPSAEAPTQLSFVVTDTGIGMDEATRGRLFSRFMQGDGSLQRRHGGSGLGLEISRNLARLMGGDIGVRSRPGEGSAFTFTMPLQVVPGGPTEADVDPGTSPTPPLRILVAEDHPINRQYLAAMLDKLGHRAHFTSDGEEAVRAAREQSFDVVLMDLHMPRLDGLAATRAIRALDDPARRTLPIVALTADGFSDTRERCMASGMNDFLVKPVSPQGLAACLRRLYGSSATPVSAPEAACGAAGLRSEAGEPLVDPAAMARVLQVMPPGELARLMDDYLAQGPQTLQHLRTAVRDAQPLELRVHAHAAKGAALNLGLAGLAATAQALQGGAGHLPAHEIARLVQRFENQLAATREQLPAALAEAERLAAAAGDELTR